MLLWYVLAALSVWARSAHSLAPHDMLRSEQDLEKEWLEYLLSGEEDTSPVYTSVANKVVRLKLPSTLSDAEKAALLHGQQKSASPTFHKASDALAENLRHYAVHIRKMRSISRSEQGKAKRTSKIRKHRGKGKKIPSKGSSQSRNTSIQARREKLDKHNSKHKSAAQFKGAKIDPNSIYSTITNSVLGHKGAPPKVSEVGVKKSRKTKVKRKKTRNSPKTWKIKKRKRKQSFQKKRQGKAARKALKRLRIKNAHKKIGKRAKGRAIRNSIKNKSQRSKQINKRSTTVPTPEALLDSHESRSVTYKMLRSSSTTSAAFLENCNITLCNVSRSVPEEPKSGGVFTVSEVHTTMTQTPNQTTEYITTVPRRATPSTTNFSRLSTDGPTPSTRVTPLTLATNASFLQPTASTSQTITAAPRQTTATASRQAITTAPRQTITTTSRQTINTTSRQTTATSSSATRATPGRNSTLTPTPQIVFRQKSKQNVVIELLVVVDYKLYWEELKKYRQNSLLATFSLKKYYNLVVRLVDQRFSAIDDDDYVFRVRRAGIYISTTRVQALWVERPGLKKRDHQGHYHVDPWKAMGAFKDWLLLTQDRMDPYDHAMAFTAYDLVKADGSSNIGMAFTSSICKTQWGYSTSIVQEQGGFASVGTAAHELGHSLGAPHDGTRAARSCPADRNYLMTPATQISPEKQKNFFTFSNCSIGFFKKMLKKQQAVCLLDSSPPTWRQDKWPGQMMDADMQCRYVHGPGTALCMVKTLQQQMCARLWCKIPEDPVRCMTSIQVMAVYGTSCGDRKMCVEGECVSHPDAPPDTKCLFGDKDVNFCRRVVRRVPRVWCQLSGIQRKCCQTCYPYTSSRN